MSESESNDEAAQATRRQALAVSLSVLGAAACSSAPKSSDEEHSLTQDMRQFEEMSLGPIEDLSSGKIIDFEYPPGHPAFVVQLEQPAVHGVGPDQTIVAFHRACPHQGCSLEEIDAKRGELGPCGCHLSIFDLRRAGAQLEGLASQNLVQIHLEERSGQLVAVGLEGLPFGEALNEVLT